MKTTKQLYDRARSAGYSPPHSLHAARTLSRWQDLESRDLVRIVAEPEYESYFDHFGEPAGYTNQHGRYVSPEQERTELCELLDRTGCWRVVSQYRTPDGTWQDADSIGMCCGYDDPTDPYENWYVPDLMSSALAQTRDIMLASLDGIDILCG